MPIKQLEVLRRLHYMIPYCSHFFRIAGRCTKRAPSLLTKAWSYYEPYMNEAKGADVATIMELTYGMIFEK